jgi:hypothetical protein
MSETIEVKLFELRDKGTFIPLMCVKVPGGRMFCFPTRMRHSGISFNAHQFIEKNWNELPNGALIDVRHNSWRNRLSM